MISETSLTPPRDAYVSPRRIRHCAASPHLIHRAAWLSMPLASIAPFRSMGCFSRSSIFLLYQRNWRSSSSRSLHSSRRLLEFSVEKPTLHLSQNPSPRSQFVGQKTRLPLSFTQTSSSGHVEFRLERPTRTHSSMRLTPPKSGHRELPCAAQPRCSSWHYARSDHPLAHSARARHGPYQRSTPRHATSV